MGKIAICTGLILFAPLLAAMGATERGLVTVRTQYFEIVAPDGASADYVSRLSSRLVNETRGWLRMPAGFSNRIFVVLEAGSPPEGAEPFVTRVELAGNVGATVYWGSDTRLEDLEQAVARALLLRVAVWNRIPDDEVAVPAWLVTAIQRSVRAGANPAYLDGMARRFRANGPLSWEEILRVGRDEIRDEEVADNAYWFLRHLIHQSGGSHRLHNLVLRLLRGEDAESSLMVTFGEEIEEAGTIQLWWAVGAHDRLQRRALTQSDFDESHRFLRSLTRFSYRRDGREVRLHVEDLWEHRDEPAVRPELIRRMERINYGMRSVHPFHFNAVLSLGQALVALIDEDEEAFLRRLEIFEEDYRDARRLFEETREALDDLEAVFPEP